MSDTIGRGSLCKYLVHMNKYSLLVHRMGVVMQGLQGLKGT